MSNTTSTTASFSPKTLTKAQYNKLKKSDINSILTQTTKAYSRLELQKNKLSMELIQVQEESSKYQRILEAIKVTLGEITAPKRPLWWWAVRNFSKLAQLVRDIIAIAKED